MPEAATGLLQRAWLLTPQVLGRCLAKCPRPAQRGTRSLDAVAGRRRLNGVVTIVNPHHWLADDGRLPADPKLRARVLRVAQFIEYGGTLLPAQGRQTLLTCRKRPGRVPCGGLMMVLKQSDDALLSFCPMCNEDEYLIYEWEDTVWADGPAEPFDVRDQVAVQGPEPRALTESERAEVMARALSLLGSPLSVTEVRKQIAGAQMPSEVIPWIMASLAGPPTQSLVERFIPAFMDFWNDVVAALPPKPWPDAPPSASMPSSAVASSKVGRNAPCPCGSGKKYKRCCLMEH